MADRQAARERRGAPASLRSLHPRATRKDWPWIAALDAWRPAVVALLVAAFRREREGPPARSRGRIQDQLDAAMDRQSLPLTFTLGGLIRVGCASSPRS